MKTVKYLHKEMIQVNENLRIYKYYYTSYVDIYFSPKNANEEVVKVTITFDSMRKNWLEGNGLAKLYKVG